MGAHISGLAVASQLLRCRMSTLFERAGEPITILPSEHPERWARERLARPAEVATEEEASAPA
jgi:hypothetical protein